MCCRCVCSTSSQRHEQDNQHHGDGDEQQQTHETSSHGKYGTAYPMFNNTWLIDTSTAGGSYSVPR